MKKTNVLIMTVASLLTTFGAAWFMGTDANVLQASSHREAPLIANDPLADNTDLYAFRSPDKPNTVTLVAAYVPMQLPQGGPNYASFGENVRYEVHVKNNAATKNDDITYRFTFSQTNEDPTTFFNIRLGKQNLKTTYTCEKSVGGAAFTTIIKDGVVPPPNIGPRSIENATLGLGKTYSQLMAAAVTKATGTGGETIYCGPSEDPFFVDLGGIFDLGQTRAGGKGLNTPVDGVGCQNVHVIAMQIPIETLQKDGKPVAQAKNILDGDYVIGVWASSSRQQITTLSKTGGKPVGSGDWVQVSRLGMPLTNEAVIPIGDKDKWNSLTPYNEDAAMDKYFTNPELGLYMDDTKFGAAVPAFAKLRIQHASQTVLGNVDFGNGKDGLFVIKGHPATAGTALDDAIFGKYLLRKGEPRSADLLPIFYTGVPNLAPYQLATGKTDGNPLSEGKPFINNFLPTFGDMLRLNMAVPVTPRNDPKFSSLGIINAAVLGLTDPAYNTTKTLQFIPNMDGFPNGRRLEDDVTRIELQAVSGAALAAVGLFYDDRPLGKSPLTPGLLGVLGYTTGVEKNDTTFQAAFPYVQVPYSGYNTCKCVTPKTTALKDLGNGSGLGINAPAALMMQNSPNPFQTTTALNYHLTQASNIAIKVYDINGRMVETIKSDFLEAGDYNTSWSPKSNELSGIYFATLFVNGAVTQNVKMILTK
jgi:hypothetical protein